MNNRFVISIEGGAVEQRDALTLHLKAKNFEFWHWLEDLWLLANVPLEVTPKSLWEELNAMPTLAGLHMLIIKTNGAVTYWGWLPAPAHTWLSEKWGVPG